MKRNAINFLGRVLYSNKIKDFEKKYVEVFFEDWREKPWEEYAKDCFKLQTEIKENIINATGSRRMEFTLGLQALYNIRKKELDYIEEKVLNLPIPELRNFFLLEYESILNNIKQMDLNTAVTLSSEFGQIANSQEMKINFMWKYVSACLAIYAIEEVFGDELKNIELNIRAL